MKKTLYTAGLLLLVCALLCMGAAAEGEPEGSGTANDPYILKTAEDLYWFAETVNDGQTGACAELGADIVLSQDGSGQWTPIGNGTEGYTGSFKGNGRSVSGLNIDDNGGGLNLGLFGCVAEGGRVEGLTVKSGHVKAENGAQTVNIGAICGMNKGTITGCTNAGVEVSYTGSGESGGCVGGICGMNKGTITGCTNADVVVSYTGSGESGGCVGGICGKNIGKVEDCTNRAAVNGACVRGDCWIGGICGVSSGGEDSGITGCENYGEVRHGPDPDQNSSFGLIGGICGLVQKSQVTNCTNHVKVHAEVLGSSVGGICGTNSAGWIEGCGNEGAVECLSAKDFLSIAGGICAVNANSACIVSCYNTGAVTGNGGYVLTGGICGDNAGGDVENCYYLDTSCGKGMGEGEGSAEAMTQAQFDSGVVEELLKNIHTVTLVYGRGDIETVPVKDGETFTLPSAPAKPGYIFMGWKYGDATYQAGEKFTVTGDMTFTAVWANMPDITPGTPDTPDEPDALPFTDVREGQWFYEAVKYVYGAGIMNGMDRYTFQPNGTLTRAMVWTMLARLDGVDTEGGATWYARAQAWAMDKGVSDGTEPMGNITREQLVTMLYRFAEMNGADMTQGGMGIREYEDYAEISDWALTAMAWAVNNGIIEGDAGALKPTSTCTRAEAAAMFMRSMLG